MLYAFLDTKRSHFKLHVELSISNELVVLYGPSGSGKTTILNAIAGIQKPDNGKIQINNRIVFDTGKVHVPPQSRKVGYVFQDYALFPHMSVEKNVYYGVPKKQQSTFNQHINQLMSSLKVDHLRQQYPDQISGGEKQRIALVRALATKPDVLLLDEPFSALDHASRKQGQEEILRLRKEWGIPFLLVTHDHNEAIKLADRFIYIDKGKVV
ncbi:ATP-binding cassette domain-containing protein [Aquibacillus sp. 3ASR75-11]|uniref:ATP-binding cassette domain-containing protein n=1 Tax=Terrihalobacillus insolitus TaxID=2950438 RepID=A0A9X3WS09_9BACI|nr:ATP-binding cassette domain-containing protein [Terrihalobacillus insolitus]MDC3413558.1 ATP-binding cassette domain-containing protein [Terrihalobacillus insolitus]MDC3424685.1 ATP-binding cassette domain-containing protein [Terrihalobacillus insolitus]